MPSENAFPHHSLASFTLAQRAILMKQFEEVLLKWAMRAQDRGRVLRMGDEVTMRV